MKQESPGFSRGECQSEEERCEAFRIAADFLYGYMDDHSHSPLDISELRMMEDRTPVWIVPVGVADWSPQWTFTSDDSVFANSDTARGRMYFPRLSKQGIVNKMFGRDFND